MKRKQVLWGSAIVAALIVIIGLGFFLKLSFGHGGAARSGLYGVFLDNGQVYFGTIAQEDQKVLRLENIYYIQLKDTTTQDTSQGDVSLLKLGNELHGPEDWMEINPEHVLFVERLKSDGKVAQAIASYKQTGQ